MNVSSETIRKGDTIMKTEEAKKTATTTAKKPATAKSKATNSTAKPAPKETSAKAPKATKSAKAKPQAKEAARTGSKTAIILDLLRRKEGASIVEIAKATNWFNHSIRGFLSGQISTKMGLKLESEKVKGGAEVSPR